jgi:hypothetical protein
MGMMDHEVVQQNFDETIELVVDKACQLLYNQDQTIYLNHRHAQVVMVLAF